MPPRSPWWTGRTPAPVEAGGCFAIRLVAACSVGLLSAHFGSRIVVATVEREEAQRAAEHKAAQLHRLGWQVGAGAAIWARAVADELARHEGARESFGLTRNREAWDRLHSTALLLVVAIDQVLSFERRVRRLTGDAELQRARAHFDSVGPDAEAVRDLVVHLDDYATGSGRRQVGHAGPPIADPYVETFIHWSNGGGTVLDLAGDRINLRAAASAAIDLAELVERVREKYLALAEQKANAALRRRYGMD